MRYKYESRTSARILAAAFSLALHLPFAAPTEAQIRLTQQEALRLAFPEPAVIERRTAFLSESEIEMARSHAGDGVAIERRVVTYYVGSAGGSPLGVAYFDAHRVRTLNEVLLIVVNTASRIDRIEVLRFAEPPEYEPPEGWLAQFEDRNLTPALSLKSSIAGITGATLTAQAVTQAVRRTLALHAVIRPLDGEAASQR
ncbi:MAG: FMN-binding protein [Gemmatimonadota bacterium]|nr:MAG: FMN-binding protein [Gemmatimonadota bacterium]